jgi:hypothetical protein
MLIFIKYSPSYRAESSRKPFIVLRERWERAADIAFFLQQITQYFRSLPLNL